MAAKTDADVIIDGKVYTMTGYEEEEYLQKLASYINGKISEFSQIESYSKQSAETKNVLLHLNIADDYFKAKKQIETLQEEIENKEKELYNIKHELIASQIKLENTEKSVKNLQHDLNEASKKIVKLETELEN